MFRAHKNSYLQLVCAVNPRVINKAVDQAMERKKPDLHTDLPATQRMESMQPSLFAPHVDITRARLGFGRIGLRILLRELHSPDQLVKLQALHSVLDQVQISESAMYLLKLHVVYRLIDLMSDRNPVTREKVCLILTHLSNYYQGRQQIMLRPIIIKELMWLIMRDRKEIRYAAAYTLSNLSNHLCCCEMIISECDIVENLIKMIKNDHCGIVLLHLNTMKNLSAWDPAPALKANAFQVMLKLFGTPDLRIISAAMDTMAQLCSHDIGKQLADIHDINFVLNRFFSSSSIDVKISAVGLMQYTTLTTRSKWRAKEICPELTKRLVTMCQFSNSPVLQLNALHVLINLCDCPDIRNHMKTHWEKKVKAIQIRTHEEWNGTSEVTSFGVKTGLNFKTMSVEQIETILKNETDPNANIINVHSYLQSVREAKEKLIKAINWQPYL